MNVKNLKQMFERKGTLKEQQLHKQPTVRPKAATITSFKPEVKFNYVQPTKPPQNMPAFLPNANIEQPTVNVKANKNFIEELNKKIARESNRTSNIDINNSPKAQISPMKPEIKEKKEKDDTIKEKPEYIPIPKPQKKQISSQIIHNQQPPIIRPLSQSGIIVPPSKTHKRRDSPQLSMDDIFLGVDNTSQRETLNARHGINQKYPTSPRQKALFQQHKPKDESVKTGSFSQMLNNMLTSLKGKKQQKKEEISHQSFQQKKITNKIEYQQSYRTQIDKRNRINFVLKVAFGHQQFQNIGLEHQKPSLIYLEEQNRAEKRKKEEGQAQFLTSQVKRVSLPEKQKSEKQIVVEQIVKKKVQENQETISSTIKRPSQVSNQFLNQLSLKLIKKSMDSSKIFPQEEPIFDKAPIGRQTVKKSQQNPKQIELLHPRQKKRAKRKQNFDDF